MHRTNCRSDGALCRRQNGEAAAAGGSAGPNKAVSKRKGAGTKMLEGARKKGQKITPKLQQMADWMDSLETTDAAANDGVGYLSQIMHHFSRLEHAIFSILLFILQVPTLFEDT
jgi:hypothetical protein